MTPAGTIRPGPGCPARAGAGADVSIADFILVVDDCENGPDRQPTKTEVWGLFRLPGEEHDDDAVLTGGLEVPITSPIARLARHVGARPRRVKRAGAILRRNVTCCPCTATAECPALDEVRLLEAIEHAARRRPPAQVLA